MASAAAPRCGIVGAARTNTGLGPFLARELVAAGARVAAIAGRDPARTAAVAQDLTARWGQPVAAYDSVAEMLARADLTALVIAAPIAAHLPALRAALHAGVAVLCEKPLVAPEEHDEVPALLAEFRTRGLLLVENCPWPMVLHVLPSLHPELQSAAVESVEMLLSPTGRGRIMLIESLSHFVSVLQHLLPVDSRTRVSAIDLRGAAPDSESAEITVVCESPFPALRSTLYLRRCETQPRPAWVAVNGKRVERRIRQRDYSISFQAGDRCLTVEDPLGALVRRFVLMLRESDLDRARAESFAIQERARLYHTIVQAWAG
jgi:hypothetical protein